MSISLRWTDLFSTGTTRNRNDCGGGFSRLISLQLIIGNDRCTSTSVVRVALYILCYIIFWKFSTYIAYCWTRLKIEGLKNSVLWTRDVRFPRSRRRAGRRAGVTRRKTTDLRSSNNDIQMTRNKLAGPTSRTKTDNGLLLCYYYHYYWRTI